MHVKQQRIAAQINHLNIPSNKTNILTYYYNFDNIHDTLLYFLQSQYTNQTIYSKFLRSIDISNLTFNQDDIFQTQKFGCLILRLLYIDTPAHQMQLRLSLKNRTSEMFVLYQTLAQILIENQRQYTRSDIALLLAKIRENSNQITVKIDKNVSLLYNYGNGKKSGIVTIPDCNTEKTPQSVYKVQDFLKFPQSLSYAIKDIKKTWCRSIDSQKIINYILLTYGALCHFQTIQHTQQITEQGKPNKQQLPIYSREKLIVIDTFDITIEKCECLIENRKSIRLKIEYSECNIKQTTTSQFYRLQRKISVEYYKYLQSQYNVLINDRIYCLDEKSILGTGAFGKTFQAQALQMINIKNQKDRSQQNITLEYQLKNIAIKSFKDSSRSYENKGYKISQKREQLIHTLFGELRYYEMQKQAKKLFGIKTQRELIGFSHLVIMQEIFNLKIHNQKEQASQKTFIVFEEARGNFLSQNIIKLLNKNRNNQNIDLYGCIFRQLLQGIYCLHYDINNLYSHLLQKYIQIQDHKQIYINPNQIINPDQRCGIYHRDIKPANIVFFHQSNLHNIKNQGQIKAALIDFGMAGIINFETNKTKTNCGSKYYMAPQIVESLGYNEKVDIWSIGVIIYEVYTSRKLFQHNQHQSEPYSLKHMQENLDILDKIYPGEPTFVEMIKGCLKIDKNLRLDIKEVLHLLYLNRFSVAPKNRQALLDSFIKNSSIKLQVWCFKIRYNERSEQQLVLCQDLAIRKQSDIKYCFEFGLEKLLKIQAINLQLQVELLKATLKAVVKRQSIYNVNYSQLMDIVLSARIIKAKVNKQQFMFIKFTQKQHGQDLSQPKVNKTTYQLNPSLTLKLPIFQKQSNDHCFILIFKQKERTKFNSQHRYFQAYKIKFSHQTQVVTVQTAIYKQQQEQYQQQLNVDLFLTKSNLKSMIQINGCCDLLWYYPQQTNPTEETVEKITLCLTNIIKYFNQNHANKQQTKIHVQKYSHKQDNSQRQTIEKLAKIRCQNQTVTFQFDTAALYRHNQFYQLLKTMLFNQRFKERCFSRIIHELKRTEKIQFKYAYNLYLYPQAKDFAHFQSLKEQFSSFGQNPAYFIAKLNMLANDIYLQCYKSKMKQVKKLYSSFMDDLQKVGNHLYKHMEKKFEMKGIRLQEQNFHNKIHYSKANLHKLYQTRQNIIQICKIYPQQLEHIINVLDKYKQLFMFISVLWQNMSENEYDLTLSISALSEQLTIQQLQTQQ